MSDINISSKAFEKLIDTFNAVTGTLANAAFKFDSRKIKRIGAAEAEVEKQKIISEAEGHAVANEILRRAGMRVMLEQYTKQVNLENTIARARDDLANKTVSDKPVEEDWTMRFIDTAKNVSREEVQDILAKILSGEIQKPGSFSYQTLKVVEHLSQENLQLFLKFIDLSHLVGLIRLTDNYDDFRKYGLSLGNFLQLLDLGLFNPISNLAQQVKISYPGVLWPVGNDSVTIRCDNDIYFHVSLYPFTTAGEQLRNLLLKESANTNEKKDLYINDLIPMLRGKGFDVEKN